MCYKKAFSILVFIFIFQFIFVNGAIIVDGLQFKPNVPIEGVIESKKISSDWSTLTDYISRLYKYIIGIAAILSVLMITLAGMMWLTAGGNASQVGKAKQWIGGALVGLVLALLSYSILNIINPNIVALKVPSAIKGIDEIKSGCSWQKDPCSSLTQNTGSGGACGDQWDEDKGNCCCRVSSDSTGCCITKEKFGSRNMSCTTVESRYDCSRINRPEDDSPDRYDREFVVDISCTEIDKCHGKGVHENCKKSDDELMPLKPCFMSDNSIGRCWNEDCISTCAKKGQTCGKRHKPCCDGAEYCELVWDGEVQVNRCQ